MFDQTGITTTTLSSANWQQRWCRAVSLTAPAALNCEHAVLLLHERTSATGSTDGYGSSDDADAVTTRVYSPRSPQRQRTQRSPHRAAAANTDRRNGVHRVSTASSFVCYDWVGSNSSSSSSSARCTAAFGYMADVIDVAAAAAAVSDDDDQQQQQQQFIARGATPYDELLPKGVRSSLGLEGDSARYATN
jgi:hypothetical protein